MVDNTTCPKCRNEFAVKSHLKYRLQANPSFIKLLIMDNVVFPWNKGLEEIYKAHFVVCPSCGNEFSTTEYKYFGVLKTKHFQIGLVIFLLFFIFAPLAVIFWDILK